MYTFLGAEPKFFSSSSESVLTAPQIEEPLGRSRDYAEVPDERALAGPAAALTVTISPQEDGWAAGCRVPLGAAPASGLEQVEGGKALAQSHLRVACRQVQPCVSVTQSRQMGSSPGSGGLLPL